MSSNEKFNGRIYAGKAILRHDTEVQYKKETHKDHKGYADAVPGALVHVFVDYAEKPVDIRTALTTPSVNTSGSGGIVVQYQKVVRDKSAIGQVRSWRGSFNPRMLSEEERVKVGMLEVTDDGEGIDPETVWFPEDDDNNAWELGSTPFVILNAKSANLNVPLTFEDKERIARESAMWPTLADYAEPLRESDPSKYKALIVMCFQATQA